MKTLDGGLLTVDIKQTWIDPDVIWTRNLLIWSQTRYRCATRSHVPLRLRIAILKKPIGEAPTLSSSAIERPLRHIRGFLFKHFDELWSKSWITTLNVGLHTFDVKKRWLDPDMILINKLLNWNQTCYRCSTRSQQMRCCFLCKALDPVTTQSSLISPNNPEGSLNWLPSFCAPGSAHPSIAQLVERRTVDEMLDILRSLVRFRLEGVWF